MNQEQEESKINAVQHCNHMIPVTIDHHNVIMQNVNSLITLLKRTSNWFTSVKSNMTLYVSTAPTASRVKLELETILKADRLFSLPTLRELVSVLDRRQQHIKALDNYQEEKECIDSILKSARSLINNENLSRSKMVDALSEEFELVDEDNDTYSQLVTSNVTYKNG